MKAAVQAKPITPMAAPSGLFSRPVLQRKCACDGSEADCEECRKKQAKLQRRATGGHTLTTAPPIVHQVLRSPGQPLDADTSAFMEFRFGHDFSRVRIHTDAKAAESAEAMHALAYTVGPNVVFGIGQYAPRTTGGRLLLAHELAHTVQQCSGKQRPPRKLEIASPANVSEREAHIAAAAVARGEPVNVASTGRIEIARQVPAQPVAKHGLRPCNVGPECRKPIPGSAVEFSEKTGKEIAKAQAGRPITNAPNLIAFGLSRKVLSGTGILVVVNPGIEGIASGQADPVKRNIEVSPSLEREAEIFMKTDSPTISGRERWKWEATTLMTLEHEKAHIEFAGEPTTTIQALDPQSHLIFFGEMDELNSILREYAVMYRATMGSPLAEENKAPTTKKWIAGQITRQGEGIQGILKKLRCVFPCDSVKRRVKQAFEAVASRDKWTDEQRDLLVSELRQPVYDLDWP